MPNLEPNRRSDGGLNPRPAQTHRRRSLSAEPAARGTERDPGEAEAGARAPATGGTTALRAAEQGQV